MKALLSLPILSAVLVLTFALRAEGQLNQKKSPSKSPENDQEFIIWAVSNEVAEVKLAEQALKKSSGEEVRKLTERVFAQHRASRDLFMDRAKAMRIAVLEGLETRRRETQDRLAKLAGQTFDREYLRHLVESQEESVKLYEKWAKDARDSTLRDITSRALLVDKDHLEQARQLLARLKP